MTITAEWFDRGLEPEQRADPNFPHGIALDLSRGAVHTCSRQLPWPAKRIGFYKIACTDCGASFIVTTAGRLDDPRSIKLACKLKASATV